MASVSCTKCSVTSVSLAFCKSVCTEETHPRLQSDGECRVEPTGKLRLPLTIPRLIFPQSPFIACHALTMLFLLYHAPTLSGYHSHLHDDPQLHRADATLPHKKLTVRDPVIQICKTSPSVTVLIVLFLQASRLDVRFVRNVQRSSSFSWQTG